jgi:NADH:ubiquinone oxidoreductase subunit H
MTEYSGGIFAYYFLAEYASIIMISSLITILLLGGSNMMDHILPLSQDSLKSVPLKVLISGSTMGLKVSLILGIFI